ncbi:arginine--tRNA ligase [Microbaculum marinisediminis]|uniref:Arginine--tRNA ligase n=1 Tax=Microbaculum marinisediminis TaxID=2931392 RepID=A0AAW5R162_9HYPH|nr:arginine--tRNA ligase [Microbaculum sp. A6E488]MCT8974025.1 arginine--tRNA ligase [Microbaculum sp. A6E488]
MDVFGDFTGRVVGAVEALSAEGILPAGIDTSRVVVEPPRDPSHGDLATNAAMVLARDAKAKPRDIAERLAERLRASGDVVSVDIAGPGFVNLTLSDDYWRAGLDALVRAGGDYGRSGIGKGEPVNVEFVSANPTGPMHVGHCRGAVFGDALAGLLQFAGFDVTREYYINDAGSQIDTLARSAFLRYREALGEDVGAIPEGLYPGDYLVPVGKALSDKYGKGLLEKPEAEWLPLVRDFAIDAMMVMIRDDLAALGIVHDVFYSERSLSKPVDKIAATIDDLRGRGLVYQGRLPPPKGQLPDDWEDREQTLFRSTDFGDDVDRALMKSDGSYTYFASDIAYHRDKYERGFLTMINVLGADHGGYVKRLQAAVKAVSDNKASLDVKLCQLVKLFRGGQPVKMSKRAGEFVTLRDVVDEVGRDVVRFIMLTRKNDAPLDFDFEKVQEQSKDNPVFYVQYAHARAHSVFRNAAEVYPDIAFPMETPGPEGLSALADPFELALIKTLATFPRVVETAALAHEPHRIAFYLYDLASAFHGLWNRGKDLPQLRFINAEDRASTMARLTLVQAVALVISSGLGMLGVEPLEEMR